MVGEERKSMFNWNETFKDEGSQYFTLLVLKRFAKLHRTAYLKPSLDRVSLIDNISIYANESSQNEEDVKTWIDDCMREGRRDIYIQKYDKDFVSDRMLMNDREICQLLEKQIYNLNNRHVIGNKYDEKLHLVKYYIEETEYGRIISLLFCKMIYCSNSQRDSQVASQIYPVVVDILPQNNCVIARVKTKTNMFKYSPDIYDIRNLETTTCEKEALAAIKKAKEILELPEESPNSSNEYKNRLYNLLNSFTYTPVEIEQKIAEKKSEMEHICNMVMQNICNLQEEYRKDVAWDVRNMVEKYFSMTYLDKDIFINGRDAYPVKLDATDQQASRVQQTAGLEQPLQSKDIFFDNKKMLQKSNSCESVRFSYKRKDPSYCNDRYSVQIIVKPRYCNVKFFEYTAKEDIDYVLHSIIGNNRT